ncbi:tyrosine-type recombinase/integrase [Sphingopyxis sp. 550A]
MALWKRAGIYNVDITAPDGSRIRRSAGTTDRAKAKEYHDRLKAELWDLARLKRKPLRSWDEAAVRWLKEKSHKKSYRDDVQRIRWWTGHLRGKTLDQIDRGLIDRLVTKHVQASDRTKDLYVALIRAMFRRAMREWEWIDHVPAFKTYSRGGQVRVRWITEEQAERLLRELPDHQREVAVFALSTGLRQGNVLDLTWDRVQLARRMARIEHGDTKNGNALGVPLNDLAMAVLQRQLGKHETHVFTYRGEPLRSANTRAWRKALARCGITNFRWHDLRHTWASWLRQNDVPTWVLQELGGWKSETMVRRYAHLSVKHLQPYADQLIFAPKIGLSEKVQETAEGNDTKSPTSAPEGGLRVVARNGVRC